MQCLVRPSQRMALMLMDERSPEQSISAQQFTVHEAGHYWRARGEGAPRTSGASGQINHV